MKAKLVKEAFGKQKKPQAEGSAAISNSKGVKKENK